MRSGGRAVRRRGLSGGVGLGAGVDVLLLQAAAGTDYATSFDASLTLWSKQSCFALFKEIIMAIPNTASSVISSDKVNGTNVYNPAGDKLGSIDNLMIDKISGQVRYAVMEFGGFLGIGTDRYPLPWNTLKYEPEMGGYVVSLSKEQLDKAPRYQTSTVPEYSDEYGRRVHDYYGVPYL